MTRQQAINYLSNSGFSMIQVETIVKALSTLSEVDFQELKDRYGDEVEYVVRDMISGENLRWVELPRPKKQEPTTKNDLGVASELDKNSKKLEKDFGELDCISRADAIRVASGYCHPSNVAKELAKLPSVTPQEPTIKALGEELRKARKGIADEKVLIGYNMAIAICNKHLGGSEVDNGNDD